MAKTKRHQVKAGISLAASSHNATSSLLLQLPDELLLQIASSLPGTVPEPTQQRDLRSLALVCKRLAPIAQETLHERPIVYEQEAVTFLEHLFSDPAARKRVRSLTIEPKFDPTLKDDLYRAPGNALPALQPDLLQQCMLEIQNFPIEAQTKEWWISDLSKDQNLYMPVLCLIVAMLPNLKHLYLGGSRWISFPFFRHVHEYSAWESPNMTCLADLLGGKLERLELSNFELCFCPCVPRPWTCPVAKYFPKLRWLAMSTSVIDWNESDFVVNMPANLEEVVFRDNGFCTEFEEKLLKLSSLKQASFPNLKKVSVYWIEDPEEDARRDREHGFAAEGDPWYTEAEFSEPLRAVGVEYLEYKCLPGSMNMKGFKYWASIWGPGNHPWCYSNEELLAAETANMKPRDSPKLPAEPSTYVSTLAQFFLDDV